MAFHPNGRKRCGHGVVTRESRRRGSLEVTVMRNGQARRDLGFGCAYCENTYLVVGGISIEALGRKHMRVRVEAATGHTTTRSRRKSRVAETIRTTRTQDAEVSETLGKGPASGSKKVSLGGLLVWSVESGQILSLPYQNRTDGEAY